MSQPADDAAITVAAADDLVAEMVRWLTHLRSERRLSPKTQDAYSRDLRQFLAFLTAHHGAPPSLQRFAALEITDGRAFMAARRAGGAASPPWPLSRAAPGCATSSTPRASAAGAAARRTGAAPVGSPSSGARRLLREEMLVVEGCRVFIIFTLALAKALVSWHSFFRRDISALRTVDACAVIQLDTLVALYN